MGEGFQGDENEKGLILFPYLKCQMSHFYEGPYVNKRIQLELLYEKHILSNYYSRLVLIHLCDHS